MSVETCFIVDNRLLPTNTLAQEAARTTISTCTLELIAQYLLLEQPTHGWLPSANVLYAASSQKVQALQTNNVPTISRLVSSLESRYACYNDIPWITWKFFCSGLEVVFEKLKKQGASFKTQKQPRKNDSRGKTFLICIFTSDRALLSSVQEHAALQSASASGAQHRERDQFITLCSQMATYISEIYGPGANLVIHIACAMSSRLSVNDILSLSNMGGVDLSKANVQHNAEYEVSCLRGELSAAANRCSNSNLKIHLKAFMPSPLLFDEELRIILNYHAPSMVVSLNLPPHNDQFCSLNVSILSSTLPGADALQEWFSGVNASSTDSIGSRLEIYGFIKRSGISASSIQGPSLIVQSAGQSAYGEKNDRFLQNRMVFMALGIALIHHDALLLFRVRRDSGDASYWILIPPDDHVNFESRMTFLRLIDQESVLFAEEVVTKAVHVAVDFEEPTSPDHNRVDAASSSLARSDRATLKTSSDSDASILATSLFIQEALFTNFGSPAYFNPFKCPSGTSGVKLGRILQQTMYVAQDRGADADARANPPKAAAAQQRNTPAAPAAPAKSALRKPAAAAKNLIVIQSDDELSLTPEPPVTARTKENQLRDTLSSDEEDMEYQNIFLPAKPKPKPKPKPRPPPAVNVSARPLRAAAATVSTRKEKSRASDTSGKTRKLRRGNGTELAAATHAFSVQGPPVYVPCLELIEDTDEEEEF